MNDTRQPAGESHDKGVLHVRDLGDGEQRLYCARPGATATWDEWLAALQRQHEAFRASHEALLAWTGTDYEDREAKARARAAYDEAEAAEDQMAAETGQVVRQYVEVRTAEEREARLREMLELYGENLTCQWTPPGKGHCGGRAVTFSEDPADPDWLLCDKHARYFSGSCPLCTRPDDARSAYDRRTGRDLVPAVTRLDGVPLCLEHAGRIARGRAAREENLARLRVVSAELKAVGRCGKLLRPMHVEPFGGELDAQEAGQLCPLAVGHEGGCLTSLAVPAEDVPSGAAEAQQAVELGRAKAEQLAAREAAEQAAREAQERAERERAAAKYRAESERLRAVPVEPGQVITAGRASLTVREVYANGVVRAEDGGGAERFAARHQDPRSWHLVCGYLTRADVPCRSEHFSWERASSSQYCTIHQRMADREVARQSAGKGGAEQ